jgi:phosphoribosylglycinamide formyltransferase-1
VKSAVILISGRGSNMKALVDARLPMDVRGVFSNRADAAGVEWARAQGIATRVIEHKAHATREAFDRALGDEIAALAPDLVLLAGFMRIFSAGFIERFERRILNIHPSLLPSFPGLRTHARALEAGVKIHGATVHVVTPALDHGPIVIQAAVPVLPGDDEARLAARVLAQEHRIYPQAVRWFLEERVEFTASEGVQIRGSGTTSDSLISPRDPG